MQRHPLGSILVLALLTGAWVGCTPTQDRPRPHPKRPPAEVDPPPEVVASPGDWEDPVRTHLLLEAHENTADHAAYTLVELTPTGPELRPGPRRKAMVWENWPEHYRTVTGHDGSNRWVRGRGAEGAWSIAIELPDDADPITVEVERQVDALHHVGDHVFVGMDNEVGHVDLGAKTPAYARLHVREDMKFKAYDLFARSGDWLVAIDDEVTPIYADTFLLGPKIQHQQGWDMPPFINGTYVYAALHRPQAAQAGTLYAIGSYGIMDGSGQDLIALSVADGKLGASADDPLNGAGGGSTNPPVLEEHVSRHTGKPVHLAAGTAFTPWTGLALHYERGNLDRILVAAGERGLLAFPPDFGPETEATVFEVGGPVLDVSTHAGHIYVLTGGDDPAVAAYGLDAGKLVPGWRAVLPALHHRIVD